MRPAVWDRLQSSVFFIFICLEVFQEFALPIGRLNTLRVNNAFTVVEPEQSWACLPPKSFCEGLFGTICIWPSWIGCLLVLHQCDGVQSADYYLPYYYFSLSILLSDHPSCETASPGLHSELYLITEETASSIHVLLDQGYICWKECLGK